MRQIYIATFFLLLVSCELSAAEKLPPVNFNREIRPILASKCFACHGPDEGSREADLRLDSAKDAYAKREGKPAILPENPEKSELLKRILSRNADLQMPPKETGKTLSPREIKLIRRWISEGAKYTQHWSFVKPRLSKLPVVKNRKWIRNEIDILIFARLEKAKLRPSPAADIHTLIRRVSLDLIGLPPTSEEVTAFLTDVRETSLEKAYEKLVDRLLKSPRYGERWARRWLDLARYADTNGYEKDRTRSIWPYRDWVINALNSDMPFDQYTIEQLAGDLLPNATLSQKIATGFHRNTMLNEEGGIDPLEFRFHAMVDRVSTTGTTWLGLTVGCAQCHSHKYDPISQHDYYRLMAFLNNADEPEQDLPDATLTAKHRANLKRANALLLTLPTKWPANSKKTISTAFRDWLKHERDRTVTWKSLRPTRLKSNLPLLTVQKDNSVFASGDTAKVDIYELDFQPGTNGVTAILLEAIPDERLPKHGPGSTYYEGTLGDFFLGELQLSADGKPVKIASATHSYAKNRYGRNPVSAALAIDSDLQTGWSVHDRQGERHTAVFVLKQSLGDVKALRIKMQFGRHFASSLGRFRISVTTAKTAAVARDFPFEVEQLLAVPDSKLSKGQRQRLSEAFLLKTPVFAKHAKQIIALRKRPGFPTTLVMRERPANHPRPTFLQHRGEFLQPTEAVKANVPKVLHPFPKTVPRNRLGFAKWLISPKNPLTARVVVNRHWAAFFGTGIVETLDDFGVQGSPPSHPQLLDGLAVQLMTPVNRGGMGWSLKKLHKRIVMSATYRQSSRVTSSARQIDPENRLLSYAPRVRIDAEVLRDSVLRAAGLLSTKMGGPGVKPPQPRGVTEVAYGSQRWVASVGVNRHRRSVYTFIKRTAPFAMYRTFDASSGESCTARRDRSNTPLQALTLLNDVMFTEAAQAFGQLLAKRKGGETSRITYAFQRVLTRPPSESEIKLLQEFTRTQRVRFQSKQLDAVKIGGQKVNAVETAVWTTMARVLFGLDEAVTRN